MSGPGLVARGLRRLVPRRLRRGLGKRLLPRFAPDVLRGLDASWSTTILHEERHRAVLEEPGRLFVLWHGRMLLPLIRETRIARTAGSEHQFSILVSGSDDGSLIVPILERFGCRVIRGSTSRDGARALRRMLNDLRAGGTIVLTPDGPRGPRHSTNQGAAWLAKATGFPILPLGCAADRAWRLDSWDDFMIPRPKAQVAISYGEPIRVGRDADDAELDRVTERMAKALMHAEQEAFDHLGLEPDW